MIYTFRNAKHESEVRAWLNEHCHRRHRLLSRAFGEAIWFAFVPTRQFNSHPKRCFQALTNNPYSPRAETARALDDFPRRFSLTRTFEPRRPGEKVRLKLFHDDPLTIVFEQASDMVLCKLRWHDFNV